MFEVSTSGSNTDAETFTPLVDGVVDKALLYANSHVNQTPLQIVQILDKRCKGQSATSATQDSALRNMQHRVYQTKVKGQGSRQFEANFNSLHLHFV